MTICFCLGWRKGERGEVGGEVGDEGADTMKEYGLYTGKSWKLQQHSSGHKWIRNMMPGAPTQGLTGEGEGRTQMTHLIFKKVDSVDRNSILIKGSRKAFDSSHVLSSVTVGFGSDSSVCLLWVLP